MSRIGIEVEVLAEAFTPTETVAVTGTCAEALAIATLPAITIAVAATPAYFEIIFFMFICK